MKKEERHEHITEMTNSLASIFEEATNLQGGNFSCGGELSCDFGLPGLEIYDAEKVSQLAKPIGIPITTLEQASVLISKCTKAPYGKGEETIYDDQVRKSWQLQPSQFKIANRKWDVMMNQLIEQNIKPGLGVDSKIKHSLYKLLLYEEGGHFDFHRDSEKEERMFGTLVIQLPSHFEGGQLVVKHGDNQEVYDCSKDASFTPYYVSFYCDCEHKVSTVTSGYRLCLIYNLCYDDTEKKPVLVNNSAVLQKLNDMRNVWHSTQPFYCYLLEHMYSMDGLKPDRMKGSDRSIIQFLKTYFAKYRNLTFMLGIMKKTMIGSGCEGEYEWYNIDFDICYLLDEEGRVYRNGSFPISKNIIFPPQRLKTLRKSGEEKENTGNEGTNITKWFHSACLLVMPREYKYSLAMSYGREAAFNEITNLWNDYLLDESLMNIASSYLKKYMYKFGAEKMAQHIVNFKDKEAAKFLLKETRNGVTFEDIKLLLDFFGMESLRKYLAGFLKESNMGMAFQVLSNYQDQKLAKSIFAHLEKYDSNIGLDYETAISLSNQYEISLSIKTKKLILKNDPKDSNKLYEIGTRLKDSFCFEEILARYWNHPNISPSIVIGCILNVGFDNYSSTLGKQLIEFCESYGFSEICDVVMLFHKNETDKKISEFIVDKLLNWTLKNIRYEFFRSLPSHLEQILVALHSTGRIEDLEQFQIGLTSSSSNNESLKFYDYVVYPCIMSLSGKNIINTVTLQELITKCVKYYQQVLDGTYSLPRPKDWALTIKETECTCADCRSLKSFLKSSTESQFQISKNENTRKHATKQAELLAVNNNCLTFEVVKHKVPYTLFITKTVEGELKERVLESCRKNKETLEALLNDRNIDDDVEIISPPTKKVKQDE